MLLAVDVGNTQTVIGLYSDSSLEYMWRVSTDKTSTADELRILLQSLIEAEKLDPSIVEAVSLASVVPQLQHSWEGVGRKLFKSEVFVADAKSAGSLFMTSYGDPTEIGADRVADAVAAKILYGSPVIIVDFGTATNIEAIDKEGHFVGGIIAPGIETSATALFTAATRLSAIELVAPPNALGRSTKEAVQSGILFGEVDRVDGLVRRIFDQLGYSAPVVATGGLSEGIVNLSSTITEVNPELTLVGLRAIYENSLKRE